MTPTDKLFRFLERRADEKMIVEVRTGDASWIRSVAIAVLVFKIAGTWDRLLAIAEAAVQ